MAFGTHLYLERLTVYTVSALKFPSTICPYTGSLGYQLEVPSVKHCRKGFYLFVCLFGGVNPNTLETNRSLDIAYRLPVSRLSRHLEDVHSST